MTDTLRTAPDADLVFSIGYAMTRQRNGKPQPQSMVDLDFMQRAAAERIIEHLRLSNYVIMQKPGAQGAAVPGTPQAPPDWGGLNDRRRGERRTRNPAQLAFPLHGWHRRGEG